MKVLIACEESQRVCTAFRDRGHEAYSCDILEPSGGHPEWHIQDDVLEIIELNNYIAENPGETVAFFTLDGNLHAFCKPFDIIIAHPPCTYLSNAGACRLYPHKGELDYERYKLGIQAKEFFLKLYNARCNKICVENPIPSTVFNLPPYSQIIQPYEYGEPYSKKTCLWLKGLPPLKPTNILSEYKPYVSCGTSRNKGNPEKAGFSRAGGAQIIRSKTFIGIAKAMAEQWG